MKHISYLNINKKFTKKKITLKLYKLDMVFIGCFWVCPLDMIFIGFGRFCGPLSNMDRPLMSQTEIVQLALPKWVLDGPFDSSIRKR